MTMKKIYQTPVAGCVELAAEGVVAGSKLEGVTYDNSGANTIENEGDLLSNKRGWNSKEWSSDED